MSMIDAAVAAIGGLINQTVKFETGHRGRIVGSIVAIGEVDNQADPFFFTDFETPDLLAFGRTQVSAVHNFIGGGRAVDLYGAQPKPIEVTGRLFNLQEVPDRITTNGGNRERHKPGETAIQRCQRMLQMCSKGAELLFQVHQFKFYVAVLETDFQMHNWNDISYTLKLEVLDDSSLDQGVEKSVAQSAALTPGPYQTLFAQFLDLTNSMTRLLQRAALMQDLATIIIRQLEADPAAFLLGATAMVPGSAEVRDAALAASSAATAMARLLATTWPQATLDLTNAQPYSTLDNSSYTSYLVPSLRTLSTDLAPVADFMLNYAVKLTTTDPSSSYTPNFAMYASMAYDLRYAQSTSNSMLKTIDKIVVPARGYKKSYINPNLAQIALQEYGDAAKWTVIADANGLTTPQNTGRFLIYLPYLDHISGSPVASISSLPAAGV